MAWCDVVEPCTLRECRIALGQSQAAFAATLGAGIVRLIRLDPKNLQSRTIRLQVDATRPGRRLGLRGGPHQLDS